MSLLLLAAVMTLSLFSCNSKADTKIEFSDGAIKSAVIKSSQKCAVINADAKINSSELQNIEMLILTELDGAHDEYALELINRCEIGKIYLPKQTQKDERYTAIASAADEKSVSLIEVNSAISLPLEGASVDLYNDTNMKSMTVSLTTNDGKFLFCTNDMSEECIKHLSYKNAKYTLIAGEADTADKAATLCETLSAKKLYIFCKDKSEASLPEIKGVDICYSCEGALSIGK